MMKQFSMIKRLIIILAYILFTACNNLEIPKTERLENIRINFRNLDPISKALKPSEARITDLNILIFNHNNILEESIYLNSDELFKEEDYYSTEIKMLVNKNYTIFSAANFGYEIDVETMEELKELRYHLSYPDEFSQGIPMTSFDENILVREGEGIDIELERLMGKISLCIDRSELETDIDLFVTSVQLKVSPKSILIFSENQLNSSYEAFTAGYYMQGQGVEPLNYSMDEGKSGYISLYALENIQGELLPGNIDYSLKQFPKGNYKEKICSHLEISLDYLKDDEKSGKIYYRYYLGESASDFSIERNTHYRLCIKACGDGLNENDWLVEIEEMKSI